MLSFREIILKTKVYLELFIKLSFYFILKFSHINSYNKNFTLENLPVKKFCLKKSQAKKNHKY